MGVCCPSCRAEFRRYSTNCQSDVATVPQRQQEHRAMLGMQTDPISDREQPAAQLPPSQRRSLGLQASPVWASGVGRGAASSASAPMPGPAMLSMSPLLLPPQQQQLSLSPSSFAIVPGRSAAPRQQAALLPWWNETPQGQLSQAAFQPPPQAECFPPHQQRLAESYTLQQLSAPAPRALHQPPVALPAPLLLPETRATAVQLVHPTPQFASASHPFLPPSMPAAAAPAGAPPPLALQQSSWAPFGGRAAEAAVAGSAFSAFRPLPQMQGPFPAAAAAAAAAAGSTNHPSALPQLGPARGIVVGGSSTNLACPFAYAGSGNWAPTGASAVAVQHQPPPPPPPYRRMTTTASLQLRRERDQLRKLVIQREQELHLRDHLLIEIRRELQDLMQHHFPSWRLLLPAQRQQASSTRQQQLVHPYLTSSAAAHAAFGAAGGPGLPAAAVASSSAGTGDRHFRESRGLPASAVATVRPMGNSSAGQQPENTIGDTVRAATASSSESGGNRLPVAVAIGQSTAASSGASLDAAARLVSAADGPQPPAPTLDMAEVDEELAELFAFGHDGASS